MTTNVLYYTYPTRVSYFWVENFFWFYFSVDNLSVMSEREFLGCTSTIRMRCLAQWHNTVILSAVRLKLAAFRSTRLYNWATVLRKNIAYLGPKLQCLLKVKDSFSYVLIFQHGTIARIGAEYIIKDAIVIYRRRGLPVGFLLLRYSFFMYWWVLVYGSTEGTCEKKYLSRSHDIIISFPHHKISFPRHKISCPRHKTLCPRHNYLVPTT